jgi:hypothetical protein
MWKSMLKVVLFCSLPLHMFLEICYDKIIREAYRVGEC